MTEQEDFERLLRWLNPDRELAGRELETIRDRLITVFTAWGADIPDELADRCIDRVIQKLPVIVDRYKGDPKFFFLKVARYIFWEWKRRPKFVELDEENLVDADPDEIDKEKYATCLEHCLNKLSQDDREFILEFHRHEKRAKIQSHANMAKRLDLSPEGLRTRAHRIRKKLLLCALQYLNGDAS